jgi:aspartyl-tRNA(Asn)/glutamyl-tRNA(Gln) amidotransferase subunit C
MMAYMDMNELEITAELAHLGTSREELEQAWPSFTQMLGYFEAMQAADNDSEAFGAPLANFNAQKPLAGTEHFRQDDIVQSSVPGPAMVGRAGEKDGSFIVIPNVL